MKRRDQYSGRIVASWSGGIDSTALLALLLSSGWEVRAITIGIYDQLAPKMAQRERAAREALLPGLSKIAAAHGGYLTIHEEPGDWLWRFSSDGREIPRRNRLIIDRLIAAYLIPWGFRNLALGEYIGADTWVVRDHVGAQDADARSLAAYLHHEYGLAYRLWTLADFGESRYKADRLQLGIDAAGAELMSLTTNCMADELRHCGRCYKCLERRAAFRHLGFIDPTPYLAEPDESPQVRLYAEQMKGKNVSASGAGLLGA